jgi:di/tripeptidase
MNRTTTSPSLLLLISSLFWTACHRPADHTSFENGVYRGTFMDNGVQEVGVEFTLRDHVVTDIRFRHLFHNNIHYLDNSDAKIHHLRKQHEQLIGHLSEKDIRTALRDLYQPENIVLMKSDAVDGLSGATLRSGKVISAIRDGLNRGVYRFPKP